MKFFEDEYRKILS